MKRKHTALTVASTILWINAWLVSGAGLALILEKLGVHNINMLCGVVWSCISLWAILHYESNYTAPQKTNLLELSPMTQKILVNGYAEQLKSDLKSWANIIEKPVSDFTEDDWEGFKYYRETQKNTSF